MSDVLSRRDFLLAAGAGLAIAHPMRPPRPLPARSHWTAPPLVISSKGDLRGVQRAFELLMQGADPLVTTTSGLAWKLSGRVGDSPIIGAGQYCDNVNKRGEFGAASLYPGARFAIHDGTPPRARAEDAAALFSER